MAAHLLLETLSASIGSSGGGKVVRNGCRNLRGVGFANVSKIVCVKKDVQETVPYFGMRKSGIGTNNNVNVEETIPNFGIGKSGVAGSSKNVNVQETIPYFGIRKSRNPGNSNINAQETIPYFSICKSGIAARNSSNVSCVKWRGFGLRNLMTANLRIPSSSREVRYTQTRLYSSQNIADLEDEKEPNATMNLSHSVTRKTHTQEDAEDETQIQLQNNVAPNEDEENTIPSPAPHIPVMAEEVVEFLSPGNGRVILDMTFGGGGHSRHLLNASPGVRLVCLDRDPTAHSLALELQKEHPTRVLPLLGKFSELPTLLTRLQVRKCFFDGVLMDLGVSNIQFNTPHRGFMLSQDGPLDMRMDAGRDGEQITAADVLSHIDQDSLYKVLKFYAEEKNARVLSQALVEARYLFQSLKTTQELANLVASIMEGETRTDKIGRFAHPATKVFQALRILVNNELNEVDYGMRIAHYYLKPGSVLAAISFHSLEDTIVKRHLQGVDLDHTPATIGLGVAKHRTALSTYTSDEMESLTAKPWRPLTKHVVLPSNEEVDRNPRSRSAKLRPALRL